MPLKTILGYVRDLTDESTRPPPRSVKVTPEPPRTPQARTELARAELTRTELADAERAASPELPDAVRLAPYGVVELLDEPVYRVLSVNDAALELMGRRCPPGAPLFSTTPSLASMITLHRAEDTAIFEVELPGDGRRRCCGAPGTAGRCSTWSRPTRHCAARWPRRPTS